VIGHWTTFGASFETFEVMRSSTLGRTRSSTDEERDPVRGSAEYWEVSSDTYAVEYACVPMWEHGAISYRAP
jgi:hypothetical protein